MIANVGSQALKIATSKWFWIAVVVVIAFFIIRRNWNKLKGTLGRDYGDYSEVAPTEMPDYRKRQLEELAQRLYETMDGAGWFSDNLTRQAAWSEALNLPDAELKYLANHFKAALTRGESLYMWVDDEWAAETDLDDKLLARLAKIGEKQ